MQKQGERDRPIALSEWHACEHRLAFRPTSASWRRLRAPLHVVDMSVQRERIDARHAICGPPNLVTSVRKSK